MTKMSIDNAEFLERAETLLHSLKQAQEDVASAKRWFVRSAVAFFIASFTLIGSVGVMNTKINGNSEMLGKAASRQGVMQLVDIHQAEVRALSNLVDDIDHKQVIKDIQKMVDDVNGSIFIYSLSVSRSANKTDGGTN